jgi:hypothetical protein
MTKRPGTFDPDRLAYLEVAGLRAYYDHRWLRAFQLIVELMHEQFGLTWLRALQASYYTIRAMLAWAPVENDKRTTHRYIRKFYLLASKHGKDLHFDPREAGNREYVYWDLHRKRGMNPDSDPAPYIDCLTHLHVVLFDLPSGKARKSALLRAAGTDCIDRVTGKRSTDIEADWSAAEDNLRKAYRIAAS